MRKFDLAAILTAACILAACTSDPAEPPNVSESSTFEVEWNMETSEPPDPEAIIHRATIESTVDNQQLNLIEFTKTCTRSGDEVTVSAETQGYGYNDYNTGVGVGNFTIEMTDLHGPAPTVKRISITRSTGPDASDIVYVANVEGESPNGSATATSETPDTYTITGSAPDPFDSAHTKTFTAKATCQQPPVPTP